MHHRFVGCAWRIVEVTVRKSYTSSHTYACKTVDELLKLYSCRLSVNHFRSSAIHALTWIRWRQRLRCFDNWILLPIPSIQEYRTVFDHRYRSANAFNQTDSSDMFRADAAVQWQIHRCAARIIKHLVQLCSSQVLPPDDKTKAIIKRKRAPKFVKI